MNSVTDSAKTMLSQSHIDTDTLSNVTINILVALIEGHNVVSDSISHNLIPCHLHGTRTFPPQAIPDGKSLTQFCAVEDDRLAYRLMLKHDIKLGHNSDGNYVGMFSHCRGEEDADPNKAICKAIISKYLATTNKLPLAQNQ